MNIFIDCEFNGYRGDLLSIGMVADDHREFYCVLSTKQAITQFVAENVVPVLHGAWQRRSDVQRFMSDYLMQFDAVHLIADWPDDIKYFCELLITGPGQRIDTPLLTMEIRRDIDSSASTIPHNALADAIAIRQAYHKLRTKA